ncbi:rhomboid family intramembrane serine protease [Alkalicaulis satelles]|uniref:Rhomboid family intramembrane serine protease n=1 Tax=Alkalicaulis satelles TaxID=2609175 RepID=A0A5M6ZGD0_9PROT|nr:rhomboid family intramembrane serine protease [Alkalicaulis satelles]KAA5803315.1 rhomboid family intramembrane serine protease [Alkalicaulis satelles]
MTGPGQDAPPPPSDPQPPAPRQPVFNAMPPAILALSALIIAAHTLDWWSASYGDGAFHQALVNLAGVRTGEMAERMGTGPLGGLAPAFAHVFLHFGWVHMLLNLGVVLAFGSAAARPFGTDLRGAAGFFLFFFACAGAGAGLHMLFHMDQSTVMAGASTAAMGLWAAGGWAEGGRRGMLRLSVPLLGLHIVMVLIDPWLNLPIAWTGHIGGLLTGMIAYPAFVRVFGVRRG